MANTIKMTFENALIGIESVNDIEIVGDLDKIKPVSADGIQEYPYYLVAYGVMQEKEDSLARTFAPTQLVFLATLDSVITEIRHGIEDSVPIKGVKPSPILFIYDDIVKGYTLYSYFCEQYHILDEKKAVKDSYFKGTDFPIAITDGIEFSMRENKDIESLKGNEIITIPNYFDVTTFNYKNEPDGFLKPQTIFEIRKVPSINTLIDFAIWDLYLGYTDKVIINNGVFSIVVVADCDDFDKFIQNNPKNGREEFEIFKDFVNIRVSNVFLDQDSDCIEGGFDDFLECDGYEDEDDFEVEGFKEDTAILNRI